MTCQELYLSNKFVQKVQWIIIMLQGLGEKKWEYSDYKLIVTAMDIYIYLKEPRLVINIYYKLWRTAKKRL